MQPSQWNGNGVPAGPVAWLGHVGFSHTRQALGERWQLEHGSIGEEISINGRANSILAMMCKKYDRVTCPASMGV